MQSPLLIAEAQLSIQQRFRIAVARSMRLLAKKEPFDEDKHPRVPAGGPHGGEFGSGDTAVAERPPAQKPAREKEPEPGHRLTSNAIIAEAGEVKPNSRKVPDVAKEINERAGAIIKQDLGVDYIDTDNRDDARDDYVAGVLAQELKDGLSNGKSAVDWYDKSMQEAMTTAAKIYPGMANDPDKRFIYTAALAITSQGEVVESSVRLADVAYKYFAEHGRFPTDIKVADPNITVNLKKVNAFIDKMGVAKTRELFDHQMTVRDLKAATGYGVSGMGMDDKVYGSAVLGPKIGQGFYQNLNGNFAPITMDLWFMRSWGRITNTGISHTDMTPLYERFDAALKYAGKPVPKKEAAKLKLAREIFAQHEKDYAAHTADYKSGKRDKTETVFASERIVHHADGAMVEQPKGVKQRRWITSVFHKALDKLNDEGIRMSPASAQATWWWPEKVLYDKLGARVRELDMDYGKALKNLADSRGIKSLTYAMGPGFVPWIDDPDPPDYLTDDEIEAMAERAARYFKVEKITKGSDHTDWMNECVPDLMDYGKDQDVAIAACLNMWRDAWEESHPDGADDPGPDRPDEDPDEKRLQIVLTRARKLLKLYDESQHPRDDSGKWTSGGGTDDHPGEGYSKDARIIDGVIHTDDVYDASRALYEGRKVELSQPSSVSVLLTKLGEISKDMIAKGEKAPTFDLCNVTIKGTSLFCADNKGIPRVQMPQLTKAQDVPFRDYLAAKGYKVERQEQYASYLRATQNELNGAKVAGIAARMRRDPSYHSSSNPIFASNDDYILDGHHRWAAEIGNDAIDNVLGNDKKMAIWRIDIPITKLLEEAEAFTGGEGKLSVEDAERRRKWFAALAQARKLLGKDWDESKHPRVPAGGPAGGQFGSGGGGESEAPAAETTAQPHGIEDLPADIEIHDPLMNQAAERGAWDMVATQRPQNKYESSTPRYNVAITAKIPEGIEPFVNRPGKDENRPDRIGYYNPKLAKLETTDKGVQYLERTYARPLPGLSQEITPLPGKDIIYRGMRAEEYEKFLQTGKIESTGAYNMTGQEGLTYWGTDPGIAESYANSFAPWPHKATFERPAYVVATKMPKETRKVAGTGENEVGVARAIDKNEIVGVWRGDVYEHMPGDQDLNPSSYGEDEKVYVAGSGSGPSSSVVWQKVEAPAEAAPVPAPGEANAGDSPEQQQQFATEKLFDDGPREGTSRVRVVRDANGGIWGGSHTGSSLITGHSAEVMGIDGYRQGEPTDEARQLGDRFLDEIAKGQTAGEPLYHGFKNSKGIVWKEGDTVRLPLTAAAGDIDDSMGYGISYGPGADNSKATVFEFPADTAMAGYARWDRNSTKDFGYTWSEAIVAGEFKVTGTRIAHEPGYQKLPVTVVQLEPTGLFDRASGKWRKL